MNNKKINQNFSCFSHGNRKKGISAIVATVLVILITVAAVTIVWVAVMPMITDTLAGGTACFAVDTAFTLENKGYTCITDEDTISVQLSMGSENIILEGVQILVSMNGSTLSETITTGLPGLNEQKVLITTDIYEGAQTVSVAPIIKVGNVEKTCTASAEVELLSCK